MHCICSLGFALHVVQITVQRLETIAQLRSELKLRGEWTEFLDCSALPHPGSDAQLNTYLGIYREQVLSVPRPYTILPSVILL